MIDVNPKYLFSSVFMYNSRVKKSDKLLKKFLIVEVVNAKNKNALGYCKIDMLTVVSGPTVFDVVLTSVCAEMKCLLLGYEEKSGSYRENIF